MKKIITVLLIMVMCIFLLAGCGSSNDTDFNTGNENEVSTNKKNDSTDNNNHADDTENANTNIETIKSHMVSGETVTFENEYITLTISELERTSVGSYVTLTISNKTDMSLGLYPEYWYINGLRLSPDTFGYITLDANAADVVEEIALPIEKLEAIGITNIGEIALLCEVRDASEEMLGDNVIDTTVVGYQTSDYANMDTEIDLALSEVGTSENVKLYAVVVPDGFSWCNTTIAFFAENTGTEAVYLQLADENDDVSIRSCSGVVAADETCLLGFWGTDAVSAGDTISIFMDVLDPVTQYETLTETQEFTWTVK